MRWLDRTDTLSGIASDNGAVTWEPEVEELRRREALAREMGGPEKVERQHAAGRLTVRERIDALLDAGTFRELGAIAGRAEYGADGQLKTFMPANFVMGRGEIDARTVVVGGGRLHRSRRGRLTLPSSRSR